ncbi:diacylglycerol kinase [Bacillus sp. NRRL B-14911]|uniref:UDP kinase n=2 Tax=Bacillus infantis TaxID=324767 RepID=U5LFU0_9BACI|nr:MULTISPECIES: diacylglycerol kinase family protein [Bacillus]AGX05561.1 UDP kinase [Bacillus infantis NRRL B-14911]EAR63950.1 diacylglycerol kinase [Bacillus sp. NRRL B-14911]TYS66271.1 diacylglycerol kinase family protein [Bacillus infantis]
MSTGSRDKKPGAGKGLWPVFAAAFAGIGNSLKQERNMRIHALSSAVVIAAGAGFSLSRIEWMFIILAIAGMFALELINTSIERAVDLSTEEWHPLAKQAKDAAAGAVLVFAFASAALGAMIFLPKIWSLFQ